ncbi:HD-GYP domain-containing protein [Streptomyces sp. NRRL B-24484]|uniref:HD-GYP domain-containing protein n=1 Tax=Streptomyces sp. NRRL B-24484 TaxID=1463833 RepID=UPI000AE2061C|nr:HD domain-containing phosphohydrolase [Streptomyces sp. NRRL B-24484]
MRPGRRGLLLRPSAVHAAAGLLLAAALLHVALHGFAQPRVALAFGAVVAVGEWARITLPGDREQAPLGSAAALAYALLGPLHSTPTGHGTLQVVAVTGLGTLAGLLPLALPAVRARVRARTEPGRSDGAGRHGGPGGAGPGALRAADTVRADTAARRLLTTAFAALLFQPVYGSGLLDRDPLSGPVYGALLTGVAALTALCDTVVAAVLHRSRAGLRFGAALEDELRSLLGIGSAIVATGMLVSLLAGEVGLWALPLFCTPLLLAQASFRRAAEIRATTGQTIEALARATETAGYTPPGHARRVADTACALGRELGLGTRDLALLEYAALMHDIGQLSLVEPVPGGATALLPAPEQQRIARLGSEVIRRTGVPRRVGEQVARLADPCRLPDGAADRSLPLAARIIRVANAHDDLRSEARARGLSATTAGLAALERLRLERGGAYDPAVVDALARVGAAGREPV